MSPVDPASVAYLFRSRYTLPGQQDPVRATCAHCGANYQAQPAACSNCGSRHFKERP